MNKLVGKIIITGQIKARTGLHIGGSKTALDIGGVDLNVIKTPQGVPFIPGSSLKGKLRSLLGKINGCIDANHDTAIIKEIFGTSGAENSKDNAEMVATRLLVRDAFANINKANQKYEGKDFENVELELEYTETKWENTISRLTGTAEHPRQLERVPAGATFSFEMVYDVYDDVLPTHDALNTDKHLKHIKTAMQLLQDDYLGGQGSRGYGKVKFEGLGLAYHTIDEAGEYKKETALPTNLADFQTSLQAICI